MVFSSNRHEHNSGHHALWKAPCRVGGHSHNFLAKNLLYQRCDCEDGMETSVDLSSSPCKSVVIHKFSVKLSLYFLCGKDLKTKREINYKSHLSRDYLTTYDYSILLNKQCIWNHFFIRIVTLAVGSTLKEIFLKLQNLKNALIEQFTVHCNRPFPK